MANLFPKTVKALSTVFKETSELRGGKPFVTILSSGRTHEVRLHLVEPGLAQFEIRDRKLQTALRTVQVPLQQAANLFGIEMAVAESQLGEGHKAIHDKTTNPFREHEFGDPTLTFKFRSRDAFEEFVQGLYEIRPNHSNLGWIS